MKEDFTVLSICRDDLDHEGYDGTNLTDEEMENIVHRMTNLNDCIWAAYWEALGFACEYEGVPKKK